MSGATQRAILRYVAENPGRTSHQVISALVLPGEGHLTRRKILSRTILHLHKRGLLARKEPAPGVRGPDVWEIVGGPPSAPVDTKRRMRILQNGIPTYVRVYDRGKDRKVSNRYSLVFWRNKAFLTDPKGVRHWLWLESTEVDGRECWVEKWHKFRCIDWNEKNVAPKEGQRGKLGVRVPFENLPPDLRSAAVRLYIDLWEIGAETRSQICR